MNEWHQAIKNPFSHVPKSILFLFFVIERIDQQHVSTVKQRHTDIQKKRASIF